MRKGKIQLIKEVFDPVEVFSLIFKIFGPLSNAQKTSIHMRTSDDCDRLLLIDEESQETVRENSFGLEGRLPKLIGDGRRLKQVLTNLIKNALKFTKGGIVDVIVDYESISSMLKV